MQKRACVRIPNLASSIVASSDKPEYLNEYLSPFLLKQQLVSGRTWAFSVLESWKFWFFFS